MVITNTKLMKSAKTWRVIFSIKDIWIRNDLRMAANELGVELFQTKNEDGDGLMFFFITDIEGETFEEKKEKFYEFLGRVCPKNKDKLKFCKERVNGVKVQRVTDVI